MNVIKRAVKNVFHQFGLEVRRNGSAEAPGDRMLDFLRLMKQTGFSPKTIYDVGANRGRWTAGALRVFPSSDYILFEPQAHLGQEIRKIAEAHPNVQWRQCAVSDQCGTAEFAQSDWDVCSRLAVAEAEGSRDESARRITVEVTTVDEEARRGGAIPDLLKIDAEGHDLNVLNGAASALGTTELLLIEAAVCCPTMENTVQRVVSRMSEEGYSMAGIVDLNELQTGPGKSVPGLLWLADFAFLLSKGESIAKLKGMEAQLAASARAIP